jgi:hypothetical protein
VIPSGIYAIVARGTLRLAAGASDVVNAACTLSSSTSPGIDSAHVSLTAASALKDTYESFTLMGALVSPGTNALSISCTLLAAEAGTVRFDSAVFVVTQVGGLN